MGKPVSPDKSSWVVLDELKKKHPKTGKQVLVLMFLFLHLHAHDSTFHPVAYDALKELQFIQLLFEQRELLALMHLVWDTCVPLSRLLLLRDSLT